ncbi:hypothetical protein MMC28_001637 [Mycoblastus sanguinarius]|nr:hypothetical protein [Mycoblastus sanguinarius]
MAIDYELQSKSPTKVSQEDADRPWDRDADQLTRLGKVPVLKRNFGFLSLLGFSCTVLVTWEGTLLTFQLPYANGGPAGAIYGFLLVWFGMLCTYLCLSELASMHVPVPLLQHRDTDFFGEKGTYVWWSIPLGLDASTQVLSKVSELYHWSIHSVVMTLGWLTITGWQATCASGAFNAGIFIQGLIVLCNPSHVPKGWQNTLLAWAVLAFAVFINTIASSSLAKFEGLILILHIVGFFAVLIPLTYLAPHASAQDVFRTFINVGGWDTQAYSFFIGLVGAVYAFVGADSAVHMAEEIKNAAVVIPQAILFSVGINGALGFSMLIAVLFCLGDPSMVPTTVLQTSLGFPFIQVFLDATKSVSGTAIMASIVLVLGISSTVGLLASSSRMFWSFARDRGLPFWQKISEVDGRTSIPVTAVGTTTTISALLALIGIGSSVAFNDIISISVVGLYASYLVATILLLWRRVTGTIRPAFETPIESTIFNAPNSILTWGPFKMPRVIGALVNSLAIAYMIIVFLFAFWPPALPVGPASMNYACLVFGVTVLLSVAWYIVHGRKVYKGPVVEAEH